LEEGGHHGCVNCINFSFDGSLLVSGSDDLKLVLWDWERGTSQASLDTDHVANIFQAKFLPGTNDLHLVSAARDGLIIHNILAPSGAVAYKKVVAKHNDSAHKLALQPESSHVFLSCGEDGSVFQIDLREPTPKKHLLVCRGDKGRKIPLYSIFIDPSNYNYFAVSGVDQFARIFDRRTAKGRTEKTDFVKRFCPDHLMSCSDNMQKANITCLVYSHDGRGETSLLSLCVLQFVLS
jgi:WD repeat-containing protein 42A